MPFETGNNKQATTRPDVAKRNRLKRKTGTPSNFWLRFERPELIQIFKVATKGKILTAGNVADIERILRGNHEE